MTQIVYARLQPGVMQRINGKKVIVTDTSTEEIQLPKWSDPSTLHHAQTFSELLKEKSALAIHCGLSGLIVLDFDNSTFNDALALNNSLEERFRCTNVFKSVGKEGGHFIYQYQPNMLTEFINNPNGCKLNNLDTLYGNCLVYAATPLNKTKTPLVQSDQLIPMPQAMQLLAIAKYQEHKYKTMSKKEFSTYTNSKLGFLAHRALTDEECMKQVLSIITPVRFKELMAMSEVEKWELHPDRIPDGNGYNYLLAISGVLMKDPSIDKDLHKKLLWQINAMFSTPLQEKRLLNIYERDIESKDYEFNPNWKDATFTLMARNKHTLEVYAYYTSGTLAYLVLDTITSEIRAFKNVSAVLDYLLLIASKKINKEQLLKALTEVEVISRPDEKFGKLEGNRLNTYKQCKEQEVFYNPQKYREEWDASELNAKYDALHPRWPKVTLAALRNSCGARLSMFLSFMARKYRTREHSPLFFVFYGVPHSFKSAIVKGVFNNLSKDRYASISIDMLNDKFNSWQVNKDLVLLDEVQYITSKDIKGVIQNINSISGSNTINGIRRMFEDVDTKSYPQELTFILATNEIVRLTNEVNERRMVVFSSQTRVSEALNMSNLEIAEAIKAESVDFAYYLSTMVPSLEDTAYLHNEQWKTSSYHRFIEEGQLVEDKIAKALDNDDLKKLLEYVIELGGSRSLLIKSMAINGHGKFVLRLHNTRADLSTSTGLFDNLDDRFNMRLLAKKLDLMDGKVKKVNDLREGTYSGNKATIYYADMAVRKLTSHLKDRPVLPSIEELFDLCEI